MATASLTLPTGAKFRTATKRRYIVVYADQVDVTIYKRSDSLPTARTEYDRRVAATHAEGRTRWYLLDTETGQTIAHRA